MAKECRDRAQIVRSLESQAEKQNYMCTEMRQEHQLDEFIQAEHVTALNQYRAEQEVLQAQVGHLEELSLQSCAQKSECSEIRRSYLRQEQSCADLTRRLVR